MPTKISNLSLSSSANLILQSTDEERIRLTSEGIQLLDGNFRAGFASNGNLRAASYNRGQLAGYRNKIINGDLRWWQNGTSFAGASTNQTLADRWLIGRAGVAVATVAQSDVIPNNHFKYSLKVTVTTADTSVTASDRYFLRTNLEGPNIYDLTGQPFTLSFWVRSNLTGTFCVSFQDGSLLESYVMQYTINSANTWEYKTLTVPVGLQAYSHSGSEGSVGLRVSWALMVGSTYQTTANAWQAGNYNGTSSQTNLFATVSNEWYITGVQLEPGTVATPFEHRLDTVELDLCRRYFQTGNVSVYQTNFDGGNVPKGEYVTFPVEMHAAPTVTFGTASVASLTNSDNAAFVTPTGFVYYVNVTSSGTYERLNTYTASAPLV